MDNSPKTYTVEYDGSTQEIPAWFYQEGGWTEEVPTGVDSIRAFIEYPVDGDGNDGTLIVTYAPGWAPDIEEVCGRVVEITPGGGRLRTCKSVVREGIWENNVTNETILSFAVQESNVLLGKGNEGVTYTDFVKNAIAVASASLEIPLEETLETDQGNEFADSNGSGSIESNPLENISNGDWVVVSIVSVVLVMTIASTYLPNVFKVK